MSNRYLTGSALIVVLAWTALAWAGETPAAKAATTKLVANCPVGGDPIDRNVFIDTDQGRVYFCCTDCVKMYKDKPDQYAAGVFEQQGILGPPRVQVDCPVDGKPVDPDITHKQGSYTVAFCSGACRDAFKADHGKYMKRYFTAFTTQTRCPVMDEPIASDMFIELDKGQRVFFCCKPCIKKFGEDPAKYGKNLPEYYLCPMAAKDGDRGGLTQSKCPKCGMQRKQIGKAQPAAKKASEKAKSAHTNTAHEGHSH